MYALHCTPYYYEVVHNTGKCLMFSSLNTFECCAEVQSVVVFSCKAMREQPAVVMKYHCCGTRSSFVGKSRSAWTGRVHKDVA